MYARVFANKFLVAPFLSFIRQLMCAFYFACFKKMSLSVTFFFIAVFFPLLLFSLDLPLSSIQVYAFFGSFLVL